MTSTIMDEARWKPVDALEFEDVTYHRAVDVGAVRIAFDRPDVRNAFRPRTVDELSAALDHAKRQTDVGCVLLTGNGPSSKDGGWAFSSGGDQRIRGADGYEYREEEREKQTEMDNEKQTAKTADAATGADDSDAVDGHTARSGDQAADRATDQTEDAADVGRLHILEVQRQIRHMPKPVVAVVPGWAVGGGHSLHVVCDLTIASEEHAAFKQTDPDVASFDGGFGSAYLARQIGQKKAREVFFLGKTYDAEEAADMGMVNEVVTHDELEERALEWAEEMTSKSPTAMRMLKYAFNLDSDGLVGQQVFAGEATRLGYMTDEAAEGRDAFVEDREPEFDEYPWRY